MSSTLHRIGKNVFSNWAGFVVNIVVSFFMAPFMVSQYFMAWWNQATAALFHRRSGACYRFDESSASERMAQMSVPTGVDYKSEGYCKDLWGSVLPKPNNNSYTCGHVWLQSEVEVLTCDSCRLQASANKMLDLLVLKCYI